MSRYDFIRFGGFVNWADEDTDTFRKYWKALIVAEANGAGTDVLLPMLKDAGLCLMECVFLMLRSDACKLFPVLCRLFPEVEEMFEIITWNDREYFENLLLLHGRGVPAAGRAACGPCGGCVRNHNVCTKTRK